MIAVKRTVSNNYLTLILVWAVPVIVLQWLVGLDLLLKRWKVWLPAIIVPTLYLTSIESVARFSPIWEVNPTQALGILIPVLNVPVEKGIFFLLTNTFVVQGMIFALDFVPLRNRLRRIARLLRRGPAAFGAGKADSPPERGEQ